MEKSRETLRIVVVGHVDHGKSTLIGRLLYDTKALPEGAIEKVKRISKEKGKPFEYAYLLDAFEEEQKQGITIDTTQLQFFTEKRDYIIIDAPGHKEFLKNMISGAANAEAALLIVDAHEGIQEQSKRHGYILSLLGIQKVYVIINKMDLIGYSEQQYNQIKADFNRFLNSLQVYPLKYIPVSAFLGENITVWSENMSWYQGEPVLEALDLFSKEKGLEDKPLRFPIQDVYKFDDRRIIAGRIESGKLKVGDEILISPGHKTTRVKSIEYWTPRDKTTTIQAGMSVGITVSDEFFNKRGEFISHLHDQPLTANTFKANLFWMGRNDLVKGKKYKIKLTTQELEGEIISINQVVDASTLENIADAQAVKINDVAEVIIKTKQRVCFDQFKDNQNTGRFVVVDGYDVCGGGIIAGVEADAGTEEVAGQTGSEVAGSKNSKVERLVTRADRENRDNQKGLVVWISGPGQGAAGEAAAQDKFAVTLEKELFDLRKRVYFLDNAQLSSGLNSDLTNTDTDEQTRRKGEIARLFADNGLITLVTAHGQLKEDQHYAQLIIGRDNFLEVKLEQTAADKLDQKVEEVINLIVCGLDSSNL